MSDTLQGALINSRIGYSVPSAVADGLDSMRSGMISGVESWRIRYRGWY